MPCDKGLLTEEAAAICWNLTSSVFCKTGLAVENCLCLSHGYSTRPPGLGGSGMGHGSPLCAPKV